MSSPPSVKFSLGGENLNLTTTNGHEDRGAENMAKGRSRFQVAKVEFAAEPRAEAGVNENGDDRDGAGVNNTESMVKNGEQNDDTAGRVSHRVSDRQTSVSIDDSTSPPYSPNLADSYHASYDTHNLKTFGANTLEALPNLDHYRNMMSATGVMRKRPTLRELQQEEDDTEEEGQQLLEDIENGKVPASQIPTEEVKSVAPKFGWIKGVLVRCLLNIYGVMLFLRLSWVVGQSGIGLSALVILLSTAVTVITSLSMSAICTNGDVKGGGAYFMISRSLGPEFGGAIGLIFSVANAVAVAMYVVGFAETIRDILESYDCLMVDHINDVRIIGLITVFVLLAIALVGMEWEARAQLVLLAILVIAILNFIIGTFIPATEAKQAKGFYGYKGTIFKENFGPDFRDGHNFFSVFSIFFPAATGILAGANISGDLQDAQKAIPKGTLLAILISTFTYFAMAWMAGSCMVRDAVGPISNQLNITNDTQLTDLLIDAVTATFYNVTVSEDSRQLVCTPGSCPYGLQNDMQAMQLASAFGPLTIAGIISATLSSALASLVSAPKVFQAVCRDKIFPFIHIFAKGYGSGEEPWRAYFLAVAIGATCICIGKLNAIAPLISNFFLMSYALINYSCFDASLAKSPGWRPAFKYYSKWLSLLGALMCLAVMFVINWWMALITFACVSGLYVYVHYRKPDINWGSSTQAHVYRSALQHTLKLSHVLDHVKNYRPQLLVLSGFPSDRQILVDFGSNITKNVSLMVCGHVILGDPKVKLKDTTKHTKAAYAWLYKRKSKAFYCGVIAPTLRSGCQALLQCVGTGKLRPNTLLLGFKSDWITAKPQVVEDYYLMINDAFDLRYGVAILRLQGGLDFSHITMETNKEVMADEEVLPDITEAMAADSDDEFVEEPEQEVVKPSDLQTKCGETTIRKDVLQHLNHFHRKQKSGTIDVWWMFDDGGLTILMPYLLTTRSYWQHCRLRVFIAGTKKKDLDRDQRRMAALLSKFRIEYSSMCVIPDINKKPKRQNEEDFVKLLEGQILDPAAGETEETHPWKISEEAFEAQKEKTNRHIRLRELMLEHSRDAALIVMTLPIPRKGLCSAVLYMAWLETLTKDLPPILLLRGNQDSVLTYYS